MKIKHKYTVGNTKVDILNSVSKTNVVDYYWGFYLYIQLRTYFLKPKFSHQYIKCICL